MEINLNDKYVITSDTYCYVLNKKWLIKKLMKNIYQQ